MVTHKVTGVKYCKTRQELAKKYFDTFGDGVNSIYAKGNMGIVTLLSDVQHNLKEKYWVEILNDIKSILISEDRLSREVANG